MSDFIVLGLVPGTHLQITFILWIVLVLFLGAGMLVWIGHRLHVFSGWIITISLLVLTHRLKLA
ncbi:MAG TPA: hypothetical protein VFT16_04565 [Candidatus Saccharimonadales bacterium]|nr:hypothetical protein [Candidatus Saccharimonadales bacterium]